MTRHPGRRRAVAHWARAWLLGLPLAVALGGTVLDGAVLGASPAGADPTTAQDQASSGSGAGANGAAGAADLGGFQVTAQGAAIRSTYEQPNFPVPANPTFELNIGFTRSSYATGPTGESLASTVWPGDVAAGAGSQLGLLLAPYLGPNAPSLALPPWPFQASSAYPPGPSTPSSANQDGAGATMESSETQDGGSATAAFGSGTGSNSQAVLPSGFVTVEAMGSSVQTGIIDGKAVAQGTATLQSVSIAGGLITIGQVTSTGTASSDGSTPTVGGTTTVSQVSVAGQPVTVDGSGVHVPGGNNADVLAPLLPQATSVLQQLGITLTVTQPDDTVVNGDPTTDAPASAERVLHGLQVTIDGTTFDNALNQVVDSLPTQLRQGIQQLPLPLPNKQVFTVDLGYLDVAAAASAPYTGPTDLGGGDQGSTPSASLGAGPDLGTAAAGTDLGTVLGTSTSASGTPPPAAAPAATPAGGGSQLAMAAPTALFKGVGTGLVALGVLLALALAVVLLRTARAVDSLADGPLCAGEFREEEGMAWQA